MVWNCGHCGRFTTRPDSYAPWGGACDLEPPDDVLLCESCADSDFRNYLALFRERGLRPYWSRGEWVPSRAWHRARAIARGEWRHGLRKRPVVHCPTWTTQTRHFATEDGQRVHGRCVCGWVTPALNPREKYQQEIRPQWNGHGGISGDMYARWLLEQHVAHANGRAYPAPMGVAA